MCLACWHAICVSSVAGTKSFNFISFAGDTGISSVCRGSRRMAHLGLSQRAPHAKYVHVPVMLCQTQGAESKTHDRMRFTMKQMKRWGGLTLVSIVPLLNTLIRANHCCCICWRYEYDEQVEFFKRRGGMDVTSRKRRSPTHPTRCTGCNKCHRTRRRSAALGRKVYLRTACATQHATCNI